MPRGRKWDTLTVHRDQKIRLRQVVPRASSDNARVKEIMDMLRERRREERKMRALIVKGIADRRGGAEMIVGVVLSIAVLAVISMVWLMLNNPVVSIIDAAKTNINTTDWNATLTQTRLQWDYIPWFGIILFLVMIFMAAYWFSRYSRRVDYGYEYR